MLNGLHPRDILASASSHVVRNVLVGLSVSAIAMSGAAIAASQSVAAARIDASRAADDITTVAMDRSQELSRTGERTDTSALAAARAENLGAEAADVMAAQQQQALSERQGDLSGAANAISEESKYLKERAVFLRPTAGAVGSHYGPRFHPILHYTRLHDGLDIGGACGQPIVAASDGVVIKAATGGYNGGSGNNVRIDDGDINGVNVQTAYLHMQTIAVSVGQQVQKGDLLGTVGSTGLSTACHLHFSVYENGTGVDPEKYLTIS